MEQFRASRFKGVESLMSGGVLRCNMRSTQNALQLYCTLYKLDFKIPH